MNRFRAALLSLIALFFALTAFVVGDYLTPWADKQAQLLKSRGNGGVTNASGAWMKDRDGDYTHAVHVGRAKASGVMEDVLIMEFDPKGAMTTRLTGKQGTVDSAGRWQLQDVKLMQWSRALTPLNRAAGSVATNITPATPAPRCRLEVATGSPFKYPR